MLVVWMAAAATGPGLVVGGKAGQQPMSYAEQEQFYREALGFAQERGMNPGWAFHAVKTQGIHAPWNWRERGPLEPSPVVAAWCKSRLIAFAKSKKSAA